MTRAQPPGFEFPGHFPIKAMGLNEEGFAELVVAIISPHLAVGVSGQPATRLSSGGKYLSVTVTVWVESREHLEAIYRDLNASEKVLMLL